MRDVRSGDRKTVAFLTCRRLPGVAADDLAAVAALRTVGIDAEPAVWDDPSVHWERFAAAVVRSTWDYHLRPEEFRRFVTRLETLGVPLWNPPDLVRWNLDKRYLRELAERGVPVLPTAWVEEGPAPDLAALLDERGWDEAVVKPIVSANGHATWRTSRAAAPGQQEELAELIAHGGAMIQPFVEEIASAGEWSLLFFAGRFSHAVIKRPRPGDFRVQVDHGGTAEPAEPPAAVLARAERILAAVRGPWLYARVDGCVLSGRRGFHLMELEMLEPCLFFAQDPEAPARFATALAGVLDRHRAAA